VQGKTKGVIPHFVRGNNKKGFGVTIKKGVRGERKGFGGTEKVGTGQPGDETLRLTPRGDNMGACTNF